MAIAGTLWLFNIAMEHHRFGLCRGKISRDMPPKSGFTWYGTSILGDWKMTELDYSDGAGHRGMSVIYGDLIGRSWDISWNIWKII